MEKGAMDRQLDVSIELRDEQMAADVQEWLDKNKVPNTPPPEGILPIIPIIIGAAIAVSALVELVKYIRDKNPCLVIIDAQTSPVSTTVDCDDQSGRMVVITKDGSKVDIHDAPRLFDPTEVAKAALTSTADAVKKTAEALGAKATVEAAPAKA
jgi:hypothetical protein